MLLSANAWGAAAPLSLATALKRGMESSLEVRQAESEVRRRDAVYAEARSYLFPTITANAQVGVMQRPTLSVGGLLEGDGSDETYRAYLLATQPLYRGGGISSGLAAAKIDLDGARQRLLQAKLDYAQELLRRYFTAAYRQLLMSFARDNRDILKSYAQVTARYASIGRSKNIDRLSADANYQLAEAELLDQESQYEQSLEELARYMGVENLDHPELEVSIPLQPIETGAIGGLIDQALNNNPRIRALELEVKAAEYANEAKLAVHWPSLDLQGEYGYTSPDRSEWFRDTTDTWSVYLFLKIPLFSGFGSFAQGDAFKEDVFKRRKELEIAKREVQQQLAKSVVNLQKSFQRLKLTQLSAQSAKKAMDVALRDYRSGLISSTDVNQIQSTKYRADQQNTNAQLNYHLEVLRLRHDLGTDLEKAYVTRN